MAEAYELAVRRLINDEESPSAETVWQVSGATSYADARAALDAVLPTTFTFPSTAVAYLNGLAARELLDDEFWEFTVSYVSQPKPAEDDTEYEFEVSASTERIFQSLATTAYNPSGKTTPNFGAAIGLSEGVPQGVEPLSAQSTFSVTKHWGIGAIDETYQIAIEALVGHVCNATFASRAAGSVRLLGVRGRRSGDKFPITYQFGVRQNESSLTVDGITVTTRKGWEILDTYYEWQVDATAKKRVKRPRCVYVHRIHPESSFSGLGI